MVDVLRNIAGTWEGMLAVSWWALGCLLRSPGSFLEVSSWSPGCRGGPGGTSGSSGVRDENDCPGRVRALQEFMTKLEQAVTQPGTFLSQSMVRDNPGLMGPWF